MRSPRPSASIGLQQRVTLAGEWPPERIAGAYAEADLFVLASYHEGYGMALAEALAHGLPIVATTAGAIPETVPADAALLVPPGDRDQLTRALAQLLDNPALRARLAAGAAAAGATLPDWPSATQRWLAALERLAGGDIDRAVWRAIFNWELFAAFMVVATILFITPGPVVTLVIATGASHDIPCGGWRPLPVARSALRFCSLPLRSASPGFSSMAQRFSRCCDTSVPPTWSGSA